jgi:hypothetical protein
MADDLGDDIAEYAAAQVPGALTVDDDDREPTNAEQANWMLRKLHSLDRQRIQILERAEAERQMIDAWCRDRTYGIEREIERIGRALEGWMRGTFEMTNAVTQKLPAGELWLREPQRSVVVTSDAELVPWLIQHGLADAVKVTEAAMKTPLGESVEAGDVLPGDAGPDHEYRQAVHVNDDERRVVPGVMLRVPKRKTFTIHPN